MYFEKYKLGYVNWPTIHVILSSLGLLKNRIRPNEERVGCKIKLKNVT